MKKIFISDGLAREISEKISMAHEFNSHWLASFCQKRRTKAIEASAQAQSFRIENPSTKLPFSIPRNKGRNYIKQGIQNIKNAFDWGKSNFDPENFDEHFIKGIAGRIAPEFYEGKNSAQYRDRGTSIVGARVTPPYPSKVQEIEMPNFVASLKEQLKCERDLNHVESAIFAHLHLARIHPFVDGNGRTSRVLQNIILEHHRIPAPVIYSGERGTYYSLLDDAVYDWKHEGGKEKGIITPGERRFYDFMAGKINVSLDELLNGCH